MSKKPYSAWRYYEGGTGKSRIGAVGEPASASGSRPKPYKCPECDYSCDRPSVLKQHTLIHTGEKPHVCSRCGRAYATTSNCLRHQRKCKGVPSAPGTSAPDRQSPDSAPASDSLNTAFSDEGLPSDDGSDEAHSDLHSDGSEPTVILQHVEEATSQDGRELNTLASSHSETQVSDSNPEATKKMSSTPSTPLSATSVSQSSTSLSSINPSSAEDIGSEEYCLPPRFSPRRTNTGTGGAATDAMDA